MLEAEQGKSVLSLKHCLVNFLLKYRIIPHTTTGIPPAELFFKRTLRTKFSLLKPDMEQFVQDKQELRKKCHDKKGQRIRQFESNQVVQVRNHVLGGKGSWSPAVVVRRLGPLTYLVRTARSL